MKVEEVLFLIKHGLINTNLLDKWNGRPDYHTSKATEEMEAVAKANTITCGFALSLLLIGLVMVIFAQMYELKAYIILGLVSIVGSLFLILLRVTGRSNAAKDLTDLNDEISEHMSRSGRPAKKYFLDIEPDLLKEVGEKILLDQVSKTRFYELRDGPNSPEAILWRTTFKDSHATFMRFKDMCTEDQGYYFRLHDNGPKLGLKQKQALSAKVPAQPEQAVTQPTT